jgi:interferon gamma-inducible protein 30
MRWYPENTDRVKFGLYYETLCPDCQGFVRNQMYPVFGQLADIIDLQLVPYGNARAKQVGDHWEFTCQHGQDECEGNLIQTCSINVLKNMTVIFPFISCMEMSDSLPSKSGPACAKKLGIDYSTIKSCADGPLGNQLEHEMAVLTGKLDPPHQFVPWVTLNGVHTDEIQHAAENNLKKLICDTYKGPKPDVCKTLHNSTIHRCLRN